MIEGILLVNKQRGTTSFSLVSILRRLLNVKKIGHAGTLDPFATGVMVMLVGKEYTKRSNTFLDEDKEYLATLLLGIETDSYDCDGEITARSELIPTLQEIEEIVRKYQGKILQTPPMFSAKKINGKKIYELARKGISIERHPVEVEVKTRILEYSYPYLKIGVECSKGTYIRSIAYDIGKELGCGAHLCELQRVRSGGFHLDACIDGASLRDPNCDVSKVIGALIR